MAALAEGTTARTANVKVNETACVQRISATDLRKITDRVPGIHVCVLLRVHVPLHASLPTPWQL